MGTLATCVIVVALWIISFVPLTPLELTLGYLFGVGPSYVVVYLGKVLGCSAAFVLGRTVCRDWAHTQLGRHELLQAIALAVSERPFRICVIVRLAYIPIALKNYGLAVLPVRTSDYVGSLIAVEFVMSLVLVTVGSTAKDLGAMLRGQQSRSAWQLGAMAVGGVFLLTLVSYISFFAARAQTNTRAVKSSVVHEARLVPTSTGVERFFVLLSSAIAAYVSAWHRCTRYGLRLGWWGCDGHRRQQGQRDCAVFNQLPSSQIESQANPAVLLGALLLSSSG